MTSKHQIIIKDVWGKHSGQYFFKGIPMGTDRKAIIDQFRTYFKHYDDAEKRKFKDEWAVIHYYCERQSEITNKIQQTRKATLFFKPITKKLQLFKEVDKENLTQEMWRDAWHKATDLIEKNKINYDLLNARMNKLEEEIKAILKEINK